MAVRIILGVTVVVVVIVLAAAAAAVVVIVGRAAVVAKRTGADGSSMPKVGLGNSAAPALGPEI